VGSGCHEQGREHGFDLIEGQPPAGPPHRFNVAWNVGALSGLSDPTTSPLELMEHG